MRPVLAFVLLASAASAQSPGEAFVLVTAGVAGGLAVVNTAIFVPLPISYPVGVAAGVYGASRLLGIDASLRNTLGDAGAGMLVGAAAGGVVYLAALALPLPESDGILEVLVAGSVAAVGPVVWAVADVRVAPAVLPGPDGERAAGLSLRVGL